MALACLLGSLSAEGQPPSSLPHRRSDEVTAPTDSSGTAGVQYGPADVRQIQVGIRIRAAGPCRGISAAIPIPKDWTEQVVRVIKEDVSPEVRSVQYRELDEGVKQMLVVIPRLNGNEEAEAILTLEITRHPIVGPAATDQFRIPTRPERAIRKYLGSSPFIETRHGRIRTVAREILKDREDQPAWSQVEAIYDYVREHVQYRESQLKGAIDTLNDGVGDCEAMTSLFIALCRAAKIPARIFRGERALVSLPDLRCPRVRVDA
jgi:transglutaminase-like putative cysteine protease